MSFNNYIEIIGLLSVCVLFFVVILVILICIKQYIQRDEEGEYD